MSEYIKRQILDDFIRSSIENKVFDRFLCSFIDNYKINPNYDFVYLARISLERAMDYSNEIPLLSKLSQTLLKIEESYFNYEIFYTVIEILLEDPELDSIQIINAATNHWDVE